MVEAYAMMEDHVGVHPNTVADTRRAAMVNALVAHMGVPIMHYHTDNDIERMFADHAMGTCCIVPVTVEIVDG